LESPSGFNFYRPLTDNDIKDKHGRKIWDKLGLKDLVTQVRDIRIIQGRKDVDVLQFTIEMRHGDRKVLDVVASYSADVEGGLRMDYTFSPASGITSLARTGIQLSIPVEFRDITYLGKDIETYPDRNAAGRIGVWETTPEKMFHFYARPQETGSRMDTRWVNLATSTGEALHIEAAEPMAFSVWPYNDEMVNRADHINELVPDEYLTVHLDAKQAGVGTASCGPGILEQYLIGSSAIYFTLIIRPEDNFDLNKQEDEK
jgi:beta-galactosidase